MLKGMLGIVAVSTFLSIAPAWAMEMDCTDANMVKANADMDKMAAGEKKTMGMKEMAKAKEMMEKKPWKWECPSKELNPPLRGRLSRRPLRYYFGPSNIKSSNAVFGVDPSPIGSARYNVGRPPGGRSRPEKARIGEQRSRPLHQWRRRQPLVLHSAAHFRSSPKATVGSRNVARTKGRRIGGPQQAPKGIPRPGSRPSTPAVLDGSTPHGHAESEGVFRSADPVPYVRLCVRFPGAEWPRGRPVRRHDGGG
jgi:hypothetical protein